MVFEEDECFNGIKLEANGVLKSVTTRVLKRPEDKKELREQLKGKYSAIRVPRSAFAIGADLERKISTSLHDAAEIGRTTFYQTVDRVAKTRVKIPQHFGYGHGFGFPAPRLRGGMRGGPLIRVAG